MPGDVERPSRSPADAAPGTGLRSVAVIIVTYQSAHCVSRCLRSLPAALPRHPWRALVIDNASSDGTAETAEPLNALVIRNSQNVGYARAANAGLSLAREEHLVFLNPDTEPRPGSLSCLVEVLENHPSVALASALLVSPHGAPAAVPYPFHTFWWAARELLGIRQPGTARLDQRVPAPGEMQDVPAVIGACSALRRRDAVALGGYDERFFLYEEDADLCLRAHKIGRVVVVGDAIVIHEGGASRAHEVAAAKAARLGASTVAFMAKHDGRLLATIYAFAVAGRHGPGVVRAFVTGGTREHADRIRAVLGQAAREWTRRRGECVVLRGPGEL